MGGVNARGTTIELFRIRKKLMSLLRNRLGNNPSAIKKLNEALSFSRSLFEDFGENFTGQFRLGCFRSLPFQYVLLRLGHENLIETERFVSLYGHVDSNWSKDDKKTFVSMFIKEVNKLKSANVALPNLEQNIAIIRKLLN